VARRHQQAERHPLHRQRRVAHARRSYQPAFRRRRGEGHSGQFPEDKQAVETALFFLQLIMRKLRRTPNPERGSVSRSTLSAKDASDLSRGSVAGEAAAGHRPALLYSRAAVVVPNGTLFGDGVCARIKEELLKEFNLHTIVRLPNSPPTSCERNSASRRSWTTSATSSRSTEHELLRRNPQPFERFPHAENRNALE